MLRQMIERPARRDSELYPRVRQDVGDGADRSIAPANQHSLGLLRDDGESSAPDFGWLDLMDVESAGFFQRRRGFGSGTRLSIDDRRNEPVHADSTRRNPYLKKKNP